MRGILGWEEAAILDLIETWGDVERSHRKLAHRTYTGAVFVSPSAVLRVALKHKVELPGEPFRPRPVMPALPQIPGAAAPLTCCNRFGRRSALSVSDGRSLRHDALCLDASGH